MFLRILGAVLLWWDCAFPCPGGPRPRNGPTARPNGASSAKAWPLPRCRSIQIEEVVETLAVVKIDPACQCLPGLPPRRPKASPPGRRKSRPRWSSMPAISARRASRWASSSVDGKPLGPPTTCRCRACSWRNPRACPRTCPGPPSWTSRPPAWTLRNSPGHQGVQSFPLLLDYKGRIRVKEHRQELLSAP